MHLQNCYQNLCYSLKQRDNFILSANDPKYQIGKYCAHKQARGCSFIKNLLNENQMTEYDLCTIILTH